MSEPAPVLIGPNSELFGSKLHATKQSSKTRTADQIRQFPADLAAVRVLAFLSAPPEGRIGSRILIRICGGPKVN